MPDTELESADAVFAAMQAGESVEEPTTTDGQPSPTTIKVRDQEFAEDELATLIDAGQRAQEIEKGGREKFEAASAKEKELAEERERIANKLTVVEAWESGDQATRAQIVTELAKLSGLTIAQATDQLEGMVTELVNPADNELVLEQKNAQLQKKLDDLSKQLAHLNQKVEAATPAIQEIAKFADNQKQAEQMQRDIALFKEKGLDVTPEQLKTWRDNGIAEPSKAIDVLAPMLLEATKLGAEKARKGEEIPDGTQNNTYDPNDPDMSPSDIFARHMRGDVPVG